jgi:hypothetical protein
MIVIPSLRNTSSNAVVNLVSRSRIRNRNELIRSPRSMARLRAAWATHAPVGCAPDPEDVHRAGVDLYHEEHVQSAQQDRVNVEEIARK